MKYIVTEQTDGLQEMFIFPDTVRHDCMASILGHIKNQSDGNWKRIYREPISAGFIKNGQCEGESETLHLQSRPEDSDMLVSLIKK